MTKITGEAIAIVGKYNPFDPAHPEKTKAVDFTLVSRENLQEDGTLGATWVEDGYIMVGAASIEITLLPQKDVTKSAVATLRKQKASVLAEAQAEATRIEGQIQSLLAITNEV